MKSILHSILALFLICGTATADAKAPPEIKPGEKYRLSITGILKEEKERIDGIYPISSTGAINIPFVGPTQIVGMTVPQAEKTLEDALKEKGVYRNPHITLKLSEEAGLPSRDPAVVLPLLRSFKSNPRIEDIEKILGHWDKDVGSGVYILIYRLDDGSSIATGGTADLKHLPGITLKKDGQQYEVLYDGTEKTKPAGTDKPATRPADKDPPHLNPPT